MITAIAIALFVILCPCISYIIVKRKIIPWNGVVMLVDSDNKLTNIDLSKREVAIGKGRIIKGLFLPKTYCGPLPTIVIHDTQIFKDNHYGTINFHYDLKGDGTYIIFEKPISHSPIIVVTSSYRFNGEQNRTDGSNKYSYSQCRLVSSD
jgi:hypothetical protein